MFDVHEHFIIENNKLIVGGVVSKGNISVGSKYYLGPDKNGNFKIVQVEDIHCKKSSVKFALEGKFSSLSLIKSEGSIFPLRYEDVRKGMCLIDINTQGNICASRSFIAAVWSIDDNVKNVKYKYEPVVTIRHIRQTCKIKKVDEKMMSGMNINYSNNSCNDCDYFFQSDYSTFEDNFEDYDKETFHNSYSSSSSYRRKRKIDRDRKSFSNHNSTSNNNSVISNYDEFFTISPDLNNKILLNFEFKNSPEFITEGSQLIINDSHLKAHRLS